MREQREPEIVSHLRLFCYSKVDNHMMWQANKGCIIFLLIGMGMLGAVYAYLAPKDELLARKILSTGICILLAVGGLIAWFSARKGQ